MKLKYWIVILVVILVVTGGFVWIKKSRSSLTTLQIIKRGTIVDSVYGIGTLTAERSLSIKSGVTSTIQKIYIKEGQVVKKGALLVELEGIGIYKAPFAGTVVSAPFKEGETVYAQSNVMTLIDPLETYLLVSLEQQGALNLKPDLPVKVSFDGLRTSSFNGRVESVYSNGADFLARISVKDLPAFILPGMTADVAIIIQEKKNALLIPVASLEAGVAVISRNKKTIRIPVKTGLVDGAYAEVTSGDIRDGDQAVLMKREIK